MIKLREDNNYKEGKLKKKQMNARNVSNEWEEVETTEITMGHNSND